MPNDFDKVASAAVKVQAGDPWEKAVQEIHGTTYSRWNKVPIEIKNFYPMVNRTKEFDPALAESLVKQLREQAVDEPVTGSYSDVNKSIGITINPWATYADYSAALAHENIHNIMDRATPGKTRPELAPNSTQQEIVDYRRNSLPVSASYAPGPTQIIKPKTIWESLFSAFPRPETEDSVFPGTKTKKDREDMAFENQGISHRAGTTAFEYPAYMMAYKEGELAGVTPEQSKEYTRRYINQIPADIGKKALEVIRSYSTPRPRTLSDILPK